jgi:porin
MKTFLAGLIAVLVACSVGASRASSQSAQDGSVAQSLLTRPSLLDGDGGPKEALRARGIYTDFSLTQFYQGLVSGDGNKSWQYGGKGDAVVTFDGAKLGLWSGFYVTVHQEWLYGEDANTLGDGSLLPVNTALAFPRLGGHEQDTTVVVTQNFGEPWSLSVGKFNMLDAASKTPLMGGGGINTFMNLGLAAPASGVTPPYIVGGSLTLKTKPAIFNLFVYDPRNAQNSDVIENPFSEGTTTSLTTTVPVKIAGLTGYQGVRGVYSTKKGLDLVDVPQLLLPPESQSVPGTKQGYWYFAYSFQQYLFQSTTNPKEGWGVFGQVSISDGNPNPIEWSLLAGIGGSSLLPGRSLDRWGIGYFHYGVSSDLMDGLSALGINIRDEQGVEAYYNLAVTPWFLMTADVQYIEPFLPDHKDAVFLALRSQLKF